MARGVYYTKHLDDTLTRGVYETQIPNIAFLYEVSTTKNPDYNVGDVVTLPGKRGEFVYAKSLGNNALYASHGCSFTLTGLTTIATFATSHSIGDTTITAPAATHAALSKDDLRGGYIIIFDGASDYYTTVRGIVGNDASDADAAIVLYLDAPLSYAITSGTSKSEVYKNPWEAMDVASSSALPKAGVPASYVSAAENYFWVQTKGICWIAPHSGVGDNGGMACMWRHDGSIESVETALTATVPAADSSQLAGYCIQGSQAGNGPLFMLSDHG